MTTEDYETELTGSREELAAVLSGVADGLLAGSIRLGEGADALAVDPPAELSLEVELEREDDDVSLELELEWPADAEGASVKLFDASGAGTEGTGAEAEAADVEADADAAGAESSTEEATTEAVEPAPESPVGAAAPLASLARFEVFQDKADEYRWRLRHRNGNVIATSGEGYTRKHNARKGLRSVMQNAPGADVTEDKD
ncbi:MAG: HVO_2922 family protein [Halobacterium sp.]